MVEIVNGKLVPTRDIDSLPFWQALDAGELRLPHCGACDRFFFPPMPRCVHCGAAKVEFKPVSGKGTLYSWIVTHHAFHASFKDELPFTVGVIDLDEGPRLYARLEGEAAKKPVAGARLACRIHDYGGFRYPVFASQGNQSENKSI
ncbi:MAG: Zn-ribbon domain-containing OB-fold protein [Reyranellaceae bacterium]